MVKLAIVIGALLAGSGVFYHYAIFLPAVERGKKETAEREKREAEREKHEAAERETTREQARKRAYDSCLAAARENYEADWAAACKDVAQTRSDGLRNCLRDRMLDAAMCRQMWGQSDASPDCSLPGERGKGINETFSGAKEQCLAEAKLGLH